MVNFSWQQNEATLGAQTKTEEQGRVRLLSKHWTTTELKRCQLSTGQTFGQQSHPARFLTSDHFEQPEKI